MLSFLILLCVGVHAGLCFGTGDIFPVRCLFSPERRSLNLEVMFILAGISAFLISLRSVLNIHGYSGILTVASGIIALIFAVMAYDMYSVICLAISLCLTVFSCICMFHDRSEHRKRIKKYMNIADYERRRTMYHEADRQIEIERHFRKNDRTDY